MTTDKTFYTIQNKALDKIRSYLHQHQSRVITPKTAICFIEEAIEEMDESIMQAVATAKEDKKYARQSDN